MSDTTQAPDATDLVRAVRLACAAPPPSLDRFDALVSAMPLRPDFTEHSVRFGQALTPHRVTHYFDVRPSEGERIRMVGERFVTLAAELGCALTPAARALVTETMPAREEIAQVVLGIDARDEPSATRLKHYVVLRRPAPTLVEHVCETLAVPRLGPLDPAKAYIIGLDVDASGVSDVKLYARLDPRRIAHAIRDTRRVRPLIDGARSVALQHCLGQGARRQLHFHARDHRVYHDWLVETSRTHASIVPMLAHAKAVASHLSRGVLAPFIVGLRYRDGALEVGAGNVYFHVCDDIP